MLRERSRTGWPRFAFAAAIAIAVLGLASASAPADVQLVLPTATLPGLRAAASPFAAAQANLAAGLPEPLSSVAAGALNETAVARGAGFRLRSAHAAILDDPGFHQDPAVQAIVDNWIGIESTMLGHPLGLKVIAGNTSTVVPGEWADTQRFNADGSFGGPGAPQLCRIRVVPAGQAASSEFARCSSLTRCSTASSSTSSDRTAGRTSRRRSARAPRTGSR